MPEITLNRGLVRLTLEEWNTDGWRTGIVGDLIPNVTPRFELRMFDEKENLFKMKGLVIPESEIPFPVIAKKKRTYEINTLLFYVDALEKENAELKRLVGLYTELRPNIVVTKPSE